jgi:hypothetical protein
VFLSVCLTRGVCIHLSRGLSVCLWFMSVSAVCGTDAMQCIWGARGVFLLCFWGLSGQVGGRLRSFLVRSIYHIYWSTALARVYLRGSVSRREKCHDSSLLYSSCRICHAAIGFYARIRCACVSQGLGIKYLSALPCCLSPSNPPVVPPVPTGPPNALALTTTPPWRWHDGWCDV